MSKFYEILGVTKTATSQEIKKAYLKLAKKYHPDTNKEENAEEQFKKISEAYDTLKDADKRAAYDYYGTSDSQKMHTQYGGFSSTTGSDGTVHVNLNMDHIRQAMNEMFSERKQQINRDVVYKYSITLEESFTGITTNIKLQHKNKEIKIDIPAGAFHGSRLILPNEGEDTLPGKKGDLYVVIIIKPHKHFKFQGLDLLYETTIDCFDAILGKTFEIKSVEKGKTIKVVIPPYFQCGTTIKLQAAGMPDLNNTRRGDLYIRPEVIVPTSLSDDQIKLVKEIKSKIKS